MKTSSWVTLILAIILIGGAVWYFTSGPSAPGSNAATTTPPVETTTTSQGLTFAIGSYALATAGESLLSTSSVPPCDQGFDYCIYKHDSEFAGTNFDSAGLSITARPDLVTQSTCLTTAPAGYASSIAPSSTSSGTDYAASVFADLAGGAAGHEVVNSYYRLYQSASGACTELVLRVAQTAYGNYPPGTIQEFTTTDQAQVISELQSILASTTLSGAPIAWPSAS
ncbi:MAG: hypothetical protein ACREGR_00575 [Minisyncoccia bacterium]